MSDNLETQLIDPKTMPDYFKKISNITHKNMVYLVLMWLTTIEFFINKHNLKFNCFSYGNESTAMSFHIGFDLCFDDTKRNQILIQEGNFVYLKYR